MANIDPELKHLKDYMASHLEASGDFPTIDTDVRLISPPYNRDIHLVDSTGQKYAVICHHKPIPNQRGFVQKLLELGRSGIAPVSVLFNNKHFFRWDAAPKKISRTGYSKESRKRHINTRKLERFLQGLTKGEIVYYQPQDDNLRVINYTRRITADYSHRDDVFETSRDLVKSFDHEVVRDMEDITLLVHERPGKIPLARIVPNQTRLRESMKGMFLAEEVDDEDERYAAEERTAIVLSDLDEEILRILTREHGVGKLGGFAVE